MAALVRTLGARLAADPSPGRKGLLGAGAPRRCGPWGAQAGDKGARRPGPAAPLGLAAMPGPGTAANLREFFCRDGFSRVHDIQQKHRREYGKIFKSHFGPQFVVSIADRDMVAQVLRAEGAAPQRANMGSWQEYRSLRGRSTGLISAEGEQWLKMRSVLRQRILKPKDVAIFSGEVNQVIADLIKRIYSLKSQAEDGETVVNINDLFFKYSLEGVATILYESRLGCLGSRVPQSTVDYIQALSLMFSMFKTSMYAGAIPKWLRPFIPKPWREFCRAWDGLFKFMYLLARHPEVQQTVYQEIVKNLGERHVPTAADVPKVPLVRALLKETLRLFPVLPGNGRVTQEDLVIGGYLIPKGTQLALCHYATSYEDDNFPRAKEFRPERWLRQGNLDRVDNFGSIPFGYGVRSCIGRRIAELEIHLLVIQLLQHFEIKTSSWTKTVHAKTHGLLTPAEPIHVRFVNRK
ncbi:cytochrome P450 27C1 isoform X3 [Erinaceus europaeus]|uniref:Cytochrome P450 27C1 isoform X3 n=1 Tax=Erinaceus europaeus TaxID=9365 RepID=A0ABM3WBG8_ERIEU|nr:cytochrome P450 27C1 isoform X3 [Erinaceus europaeus]